MLEEQEIEVVRSKLSASEWVDTFDIIKGKEKVYLLMVAPDDGSTIKVENDGEGLEEVPGNIARAMWLLEDIFEGIGPSKTEVLVAYLAATVDEFLDRRQQILKEEG